MQSVHEGNCENARVPSMRAGATVLIYDTVKYCDGNETKRIFSLVVGVRYSSENDNAGMAKIAPKGTAGDSWRSY